MIIQCQAIWIREQEDLLSDGTRLFNILSSSSKEITRGRVCTSIVNYIIIARGWKRWQGAAGWRSDSNCVSSCICSQLQRIYAPTRENEKEEKRGLKEHGCNATRGEGNLLYCVYVAERIKSETMSNARRVEMNWTRDTMETLKNSLLYVTS